MFDNNEGRDYIPELDRLQMRILKISVDGINKIQKGEVPPSLNEVKAQAIVYFHYLLVQSEYKNRTHKELSFWNEIEIDPSCDWRRKSSFPDYEGQTHARLMRKSLAYMQPQDRIRFFEWASGHLDEIADLFWEDEDGLETPVWLFDSLDITQPDVKKGFQNVWYYLKEKIFFHADRPNTISVDEFELYLRLHPKTREVLLKSLEELPVIESKLASSFLDGSFMKSVWLIAEIQSLRNAARKKEGILDYFDDNLWDDPETSDQDAYEQVARSFLTLDDGQRFYTSLADLYKDIDFDKYPTNAATIEARLQWIKKQLQENKDEIIIDLGCGTGDTAIELLKDGFTYVYGIDVSEKNVQEAKQKLLMENPDEHSERFMVGDWEHLPYANNSVDHIICLGRSLTHAEDPVVFNRILREVSRVLKPGGKFIFDFPDPDKGIYLENKQKYNSLLRQKYSFKFLEGVELPYVVDSPDGNVFYNRYVPDEQVIEDHLVLNGFTLDKSKTIRTPIPGWNNSENMQFVAIKK